MEQVNWEQAFKIIEPIPTADYVSGCWPEVRYEKCKALFQLAQEVKEGCIVELGTWRGLGAITLALGASVTVYTIDDRKPHQPSRMLEAQPVNYNDPAPPPKLAGNPKN